MRGLTFSSNSAVLLPKVLTLIWKENYTSHRRPLPGLAPALRPTQTGNPSPADGLQLFITDLMGAGLSKDQIMTMGREVTGKLLMG